MSSSRKWHDVMFLSNFGDENRQGQTTLGEESLLSPDWCTVVWLTCILPLLSPVISRRPDGSIVIQEISSIPCASVMCWDWRPVFRSQKVITDPSQPVITCPILALYNAAHNGLQWVVLVLLLALIATILISAKQSLLPINRELMGDVMRKNGNGPCSGILWPNGNLTGMVWRQTCSLISQDFNTCKLRWKE